MSGDEVDGPPVAVRLGPTGALPPRPRPGDRRPPRPTRPVRADAASALAGAALSVLAVGLGIVGVNWVGGPPPPSTSFRDDLAASEVVVLPSPSPSSSSAPAPVTGRPGAVLTGPSAPSPRPVASPSPPSLVVPVTVLNNSRRDGLAERASERFRAGGWPVALVGNFRGRIPVTTVYYDPGLEASAEAFARRFEGVARVRPRFPGLPARGVVVVVTREFGP